MGSRVVKLSLCLNHFTFTFHWNTPSYIKNWFNGSAHSDVYHLFSFFASRFHRRVWAVQLPVGA